MNKRKQYTFFLLAALGLLTSCSSASTSESEDSSTPSIVTEDSILVAYPGRTIPYSQKFNDLNAKHLDAAQRSGLSVGPKSRKDAAYMHNRLCRIQTNKNYLVEDLTHSVPYLVPIAADRLNAIGNEWADLLKRNDLPHYRFRVTSVLRTQEDIASLKRVNGNASETSAHNFGTTFDIAYWKYDKVSQSNKYMTEDNLKLALAQVLLNQQRAGHIYVKYESKQCCFHITVIN